MNDLRNKFACLACGALSAVPRYNSTGKLLPWNCGDCGGKHELAVIMDVICDIRLLDRVHARLRAGLPSEIRASLYEATVAINAGAPRAACAMLRRVAELICRHVAPNETGTLDQRIKAVTTQAKVLPHTGAGLHALRLLGNDAVHLEGRFYDDVTLKEAEGAHRLMLDLVETIFP